MSASLLIPNFSHAYAEPSVIQGLVARQSVLPVIKPSWGNFILHTDTLNKLYTARGYQAIWVDSNGLPNSMALNLKTVLQRADRHGLNNQDYWDTEVENLYNAVQKNQKNWITFELALSEALIRYVTHLSTGRFDPEKVDTDIKNYPRKTFTDYARLNSALSNADLLTALDSFAPTHPRYIDLMNILVTLKTLRDQGGWTTLTSPGFALKLGVEHPVIGQIRARLNQLGYAVSATGGNMFDEDFRNALVRYQNLNGLDNDGVIGTRSEVLRTLSYSVNQRIAQVELTMEKLRWLPKQMEARHIFVNLATTEFFLFDEQGLSKHFKTVNGGPFNRTPSMRDQMTNIILNPDWSVPSSIAENELFESLQKDSSHLDKKNMLLFNKVTQQQLDPYSIDWKNMTAKEFKEKPYYFQQLPGPDNSLGVIKFPLQNPYSIYMHDTNQKEFFDKGKRHLSHGCVRLEEPLGLAAYLLQDQPGWSLDEIRAYVPNFFSTQGQELRKRVNLTKPMPVYFMYLTVEKSENGEIRFVEDDYGQDLRLSKALQNKRNNNELF
ncbi:MAG: L,D-transpeptidase family protein [Bdellovibrio sp.]